MRLTMKLFAWGHILNSFCLLRPRFARALENELLEFAEERIGDDRLAV